MGNTEHWKRVLNTLRHSLNKSCETVTVFQSDDRLSLSRSVHTVFDAQHPTITLVQHFVSCLSIVVYVNFDSWKLEPARVYNWYEHRANVVLKYAAVFLWLFNINLCNWQTVLHNGMWKYGLHFKKWWFHHFKK